MLGFCQEHWGDAMRMSRRMALGRVPNFKYTYSGTATFSGDSKGDWTLTIKSSGTLKVQSLPKGKTIDVFLVGGGGGGQSGGVYYPGGGGGGYTTTASNVSITSGSSYSITIGAGGTGAFLTNANGGTTSAFDKTANGGTHGWSGHYFGSGSQYGGPGMGGSGGAGEGGTAGTNGGDGSGAGLNRTCYYDGTYWHSGTSTTYTTYTMGKGQGKTTRAFGGTSGTAYAQGGANTGDKSSYTNGTANTGNGGEGGYSANTSTGGSGGSGIVIIRNHRA